MAIPAQQTKKPTSRRNCLYAVIVPFLLMSLLALAYGLVMQNERANQFISGVILSESKALRFLDRSQINSIVSGMLPDEIVQTAEIADKAITTVKIDDGSVTSEKIADGTILSIDISSSAISTINIGDGAITNSKLADNSVTGEEILNGTIVLSDLGQNGCASGQAMKWSSSFSSWVCGEDASLSEAQVEAYIFDTDNTGTLGSGTLALSSISYTGNLPIAYLPLGGNWSLSSNLNIDSNTLYIDQANNRVGIGTTSPGYTLDVNGMIRTNNPLRFSIPMPDGTSNILITSDLSPLSIMPAQARAIIIGGTISNSGNSGYSVNIGGTDFGGNNSYYNTIIGFQANTTVDKPGIVVIGKSASGTGANSVAVGRDTTVAAYSIAIGYNAKATGSSSASFGAGTVSANNLYAYGGASTINYFAGNVGIGTTGPDAKLSIQAPAGGVGNLMQSYKNSGGDTRFTFLYDGTNIKYSIGDRSSSPLFTIEEVSGNVGIGTTSPTGAAGTSDLEVTGGIRVGTLDGPSATDLCIDGDGDLSSCDSSLRYKENVVALTLGLDTVEKLNPVTFDWKGTGEADLGFIAEDVEKIDPILATYRNGQVEGVKYKQLTAVLVNAIKEQQEQIEELSAHLAELETAGINNEPSDKVSFLTVEGLVVNGDANIKGSLMVDSQGDSYFLGNVGIGTSKPASKLHVKEGDVYIDTVGKGIIMRSPNGSCFKLTVDDDGSLSTTSVTCP